MSKNLVIRPRKNSALTGSAANARTLSPNHHHPPVWRRLPGRLGRGAELLTLFTYACVAKIAWQIGEGGGASHSLYLRLCGKDCLADWGGGRSFSLSLLTPVWQRLPGRLGRRRSFSLSLLTPVWQRLPGRLGRGTELLTLFTYACVAKIAWQIGEGDGASHSLYLRLCGKDCLADWGGGRSFSLSLLTPVWQRLPGRLGRRRSFSLSLLTPVWQRLPGRLGRGTELLTLFTYACLAKIPWQIGEGGGASHSVYLRLCGKDCLADWGGGRSFSLSLLTPVWQRLPGRLGRGAELLTLFTHACVAKIAWQIWEGGGSSHSLY